MNKDDKRRCTILNMVHPLSYKGGGIAYVSGITLDQIKLLVGEGFADPEDSQNDSPTIGEFVDFLTNNPKFTLGGYLVDPERPDYRVSIDSMVWNETDKLTQEELEAFVEFAHGADEFKINPPSAWWD